MIGTLKIYGELGVMSDKVKSGKFPVGISCTRPDFGVCAVIVGLISEVHNGEGEGVVATFCKF